MFESLEYRRLLAAAIDGSGNLIVNGDTTNDTITLTLSGTNIVVDIQPENFNDSFAIADITSGVIGIIGAAGNDTITVAADITLGAVIQGDDGNDTITGGGGDDNIQGGDGNDVMSGGPGADSISGDNGIDTVTYASRTAALSLTLDNLNNDGEDGENDALDSSNDILIGGAGDDRIHVGAQSDGKFLYGLGGNDTLVGGSGGDRLNGGQGNDDLRGNAGDDILLGGPNSDVLNGGAGNDTASWYYSLRPVTVTIDALSNDGVVADRENDNVKADVENVIGGTQNDNITGSDANNILDGRAGNDTLTGGAGTDQMFGRAGDDSFFAVDGEIDTLDGGLGTDVADADDDDVLVDIP